MKETEIEKVFVNVANARTPEYRAMLEKIVEEGIDPFAIENVNRYHPKPILREGAHWYIIESEHFYKNALYHFLFVSKSYAEKLCDMTPEMSVELYQLCADVELQYKVKGGAICMRFGETSRTGATVKRLHAHFIVADLRKGVVTFPMGKSRKKKK